MKPMKVSSFFFDPAQLRTGHDLLSMLAVAVFGFLNGYCVSLSLIVVIEIPDLSQEQRKTCDFVQAFQVFTLGSTVESHPKGSLKPLIERKDNQRTFRQQHRTPTSLAALGDTLILQFRCDFSLVLTCLEMAEVLTDSWKQHMGGSKNYSRRSPAGSAAPRLQGVICPSPSPSSSSSSSSASSSSSSSASSSSAASSSASSFPRLLLLLLVVVDDDVDDVDVVVVVPGQVF